MHRSITTTADEHCIVHMDVGTSLSAVHPHAEGPGSCLIQHSDSKGPCCTARRPGSNSRSRHIVSQLQSTSGTSHSAGIASQALEDHHCQSLTKSRRVCLKPLCIEATFWISSNWYAMLMGSTDTRASDSINFFHAIQITRQRGELRGQPAKGTLM